MTMKSRGEAITLIAEEHIKDKHVFHIGCGTGKITQEFSKLAKKITAVEVEEDKAAMAEKRQYHCETKIIHGDAIQYFSDMNSCPDTFYLWAGWKPKKQGIQWWMENIYKFFGDSSSDVICGLSMAPVTGQCHGQKHSFQFYAAKVLQKIYGAGDIIITGYVDEEHGILPYAIFKINLDDVKPTGFKNPAPEKWKLSLTQTITNAMSETNTWGGEECPHFHMFEKHYMSFIGE